MADSDEDFDNSSSRQRRGKFRNERDDMNMRDGFRQADRSASENNFNRHHNNNRHNNNYGNYRRNGGDQSPKYNRGGGYSPRRSEGQNYMNQPINSPPMRNNQYGGSRYEPHDNNMMYKRPLSPPGNGHFNPSHSMSNFNGHPAMSSQFYNDNRPSFPSQVPYRGYDDRPRSPDHPAYFYDQAQKKQRREWSGFNDMMPGSSYIEHDNRNSPEYYPDRFYDDYNQRAPNNGMPMYNNNFNHQYDNGNFYPNPAQQQRGFSNQGFNQNNGYNNMYNNEFPHMNNGPMNNMNNNFMQPQINPMMTDHIDKRNNNGNRGNGNQSNNGTGDTQPPMISFKQFINNLNETDPSTASLAPEEATKRYNDYKNDFRCTQIASFFANHKHEEWFKQRYHPEVSGKRKDEQRSAVLRRLDIFNELLKRFNTESRRVSLDMSEPVAEKYLLKFIDACMIKLEEGTDQDLEILEKIYKIENVNEDEKLSGQESKSDVKDEPVDNGQKEETKETKPEMTTGPILIPQKVQSIFFKHLPVNVTRQDLEQIGGKYDGFKRASISEPAPERRFQRRGWITFDSTVNIKDICSKINGYKIQDMILYPTINRELDQKVKCIIGLSNHKQIVQNDLKIITKIVQSMDKRWGLWEFSGSYSNNKLKDEDFQTDSDRKRLKKAEAVAGKEPDNTPAKEEKETPETVVITENNPLVELAKSYLKELSDGKVEVKADEIAEEKSPNSKTSTNSTFKLDLDKRAASILDDLILYLRIVHSIDYYNATEYQQEDWMPNRIGILHVRGSIAHKSSSSSSIVNIFNGVNINYFDAAAIKKVQVEEWLRLFEQHIKSYHEYRAEIDTDLAKRLGLKDLKEEIDKYIASNTKKLDKDIWLCPISGKKFKGPEYVKKYIETKCRDKLLELRADVEYFNRFVYDPKRPYLPEHPMTRNMGHNNNHNHNQGNNKLYNKNSHGHNNQGMMNQGGQCSMPDQQFYNNNQGYESSSFQHESYGYGGAQYGLMRGGGSNNQQGYPNQPMGHMNNRSFRR